MNMIDTESGKETSATRATYLALRDMILLGELPAGQKLKVEELRKKLNVGASPVREALSLLTSDMLVERIDQRGFRASPANNANFQEILTLRCTLEDLALRQSMALATSAWEEALVLAHHRQKKLRGTDPTEFEEAHKSFHMALIAGSQMPMLQRYCSQLYDLNIRYRNLAARSKNYEQRDASGEHDDILDAAISGDADRASDALMSHYRLTGEYLSRALLDQSPEPATLSAHGT